MKTESELRKTRDRPIKILELSLNTVDDYFYYDFDDLIEFVRLLPPTKWSIL